MRTEPLLGTFFLRFRYHDAKIYGQFGCEAKHYIPPACKLLLLVFMKILGMPTGIDFQTNFLAWERYGVGRFLVFMFLEGLIFFAILFTIEYDVPAILVQTSRRIWRRVNVNIVLLIKYGQRRAFESLPVA